MSHDSSISRRGFMLTTAAGATGGMLSQKAALGTGHLPQLHSLSGIPTGFAQINGLTGGLHRGELTVLASRPAAGKTTLALNLTEFVSVECAIASDYFCFSTYAEEIVWRLLSYRAGFCHTAMDPALLSSASPDVRQRTIDTARELAKSPIYVDDRLWLTAAHIRKAAERLHERLPTDHPLGLLVVDHLHCVAADNRHGKSRDEHLLDVTRELRSIAQDLNLAVLGLVQLNCPQTIVVYDDPVLNQLCDIQSAADTVMLLHGPEYDQAPADRGGAGPEGVSLLSVITRTDAYAKTVELCRNSQCGRFS